MQAGAEDFLEKPYEAEHLLQVVARALARADRAEDLARRADLALPQAGDPLGALLGDSAAMADLRGLIQALAPLEVDVVISGETGSGKELVARALHGAGPRAAGPYVAVNCAAIPEALFEAEMFGVAQGALPGAEAARPGKFEAAEGGMLVLDALDALSLAAQAKLLRALEERATVRLGEVQPRAFDLRLVAITKSPLRASVSAGTFREDLFYRLAGAEVDTPPLRDRGIDIPLIFAHYARAAAARHARPAPDLGFALRRDLARYGWPGNVRELKILAERYALGLEARVPRAGQGLGADLGSGLVAGQGVSTGASAEILGGETLSQRLADFEAREIRAALERARGNTERAALLLGLPRRTLSDRMRRLGLTA
jgi:two-component system, NtrC family, C4-dicarboxylate transport response regulator DctD